jgi:hypothetical protein
MAPGRRSGTKLPRLTPRSAKNMVGVAKVLGPAVVPVVAPYALRVASAARERLDRYRARRLGVDVADLAEYSGRGGALHARIVGIDRSLAALESLAGLESRTGLESRAADREFAARNRVTLAEWAAAVRAAERMPGARRRAAHRAVAAGLDPIERDLLRRLGLPGT